MPLSKGRKRLVRQPKQMRAKATVETILAAGARILAREGWDGFNTNAVAARAGVSIGSVYEYFCDKQALIDAVANQHLLKCEMVLADASVTTGQSLEVTDLVELLVEGAIALHADDPQLHRALSSEARLSPSVRQRAANTRAGFVEFVARRLRPFVPEPRHSAQLLVDVTDSIVHRWWIEDDGSLTDPQRLTEELKTMLCAYVNQVAKRPGQGAVNSAGVTAVFSGSSEGQLSIG